MVIIPRRYPLKFREMKTIKSHYGFLGLSKEVNKYYIFANGANEHGLAVAVLYFEGYTHCNEKKLEKNKPNSRRSCYLFTSDK